MKAKLKPANMLIYKEPLVELADGSLENYKVSGDYEKKILILTDEIQKESDEETLLSKMLKATKIEQKDIYHIQINDTLPTRMLTQLRANQVICFGTFLDNPSIHFSALSYQVQEVNGMQLLNINKLSEINNSSEMKQALWNGLKKMFNI